MFISVTYLDFLNGLHRLPASSFPEEHQQARVYIERENRLKPLDCIYHASLYHPISQWVDLRENLQKIGFSCNFSLKTID